MKKKIKNAQQFFEYFVKIAGELELYKIMYGEMPTDKDSAKRLLNMQAKYKEFKPLRDEIERLMDK